MTQPFLISDPDFIKALQPVSPGTGSVVYRGVAEPKLIHLEVPPEQGGTGILIAHLLIGEESLAYKAFEEWLKEAIRQAAEKVRGFYGLEGILLDLQELSGWNLAHFVTLVTQHAAKLKPGEKKLIRYGGFYAVLSQRIEENWGKIEFKLPVTVYTQALAQFDLFIKKRTTALPQRPLVLWLRDLGQQPVFRFGDPEQTPRLRKLLEKWSQLDDAQQGTVYYQQGDKIVDLAAQFGFRL